MVSTHSSLIRWRRDKGFIDPPDPERNNGIYSRLGAAVAESSYECRFTPASDKAHGKRTRIKRRKAFESLKIQLSSLPLLRLHCWHEYWRTYSNYVRKISDERR